MQALHGIAVLVTRPEQQAAPLCRLLEAQGANTLRLPAIEIRPHDDGRAAVERLGALDEADLIIFTSANAVRFGAPLLDPKRDLTLAAIGPATAHALTQAGYRVTVLPGGGFDSESLLAHPRLQQVAGRRILLIKGTDGRGLLEGELSRRGAQVIAVEVYRRTPASPSRAALRELQQRFAAGALQVITATSLQIATHLLDLATPALRSDFERVHWLVPGARIAAGLRERGLTAPLIPADSAEDHDLVEALIRWRSKVSGA